MKYVLSLCLVLAAFVLTSGCMTLRQNSDANLHRSNAYYNYIQPTYSEYLNATREWLTANRAFITDDHSRELEMNMPFELSPDKKVDKAVLLVHGLGDSPYSFSDIGRSLVKEGFYVQSLLLPGHGSKPTDLEYPLYEDWQSIVDHYAKLLKQEYSEVWLGGFSTGANLVTIHTLESGGVDGLLLFSPGFVSRTPWLEKLAPALSLFIDGYNADEKNIARYTSAPLNGAIAYSKSASKVRSLLRVNDVSIPSLIVMSEADSVVDPEAIKSIYETKFKNANNKLIWYGDSVFDLNTAELYTMQLDQYKISTGSHMSPLFSPDNVYYGEYGERRMCLNSLDNDSISRCESGESVWYSAWGYEEDGKIHARLTWNPYYEQLERELHDILISELQLHVNSH